MKDETSEFDTTQRHTLAQMLSRRQFFSRLGTGAGALALASLFAEESRASSMPSGSPHYQPRIKRIIYLFQNGGPSQVDLFDPKPELKRREGEKPGQDYVNDVDAKKTGVWLSSPFRFVRYGQSGMELSELLPESGKHVDKIAVIRSM